MLQIVFCICIMKNASKSLKLISQQTSVSNCLKKKKKNSKYEQHTCLKKK